MGWPPRPAVREALRPATGVGGDGAAEGSPTVVVPTRALAINSRPAANGQFLPPAGEHFSVSGGTDGRYVMSYELVGDTSIEVHALAR